MTSPTPAERDWKTQPLAGLAKESTYDLIRKREYKWLWQY